jgi:hypothetical protein
VEYESCHAEREGERDRERKASGRKYTRNLKALLANALGTRLKGINILETETMLRERVTDKEKTLFVSSLQPLSWRDTILSLQEIHQVNIYPSVLLSANFMSETT